MSKIQIGTNDDRATRAQQTLLAGVYLQDAARWHVDADVTDGDWEAVRAALSHPRHGRKAFVTAVADLISDLRHLCDREGVDWSQVIDRADDTWAGDGEDDDDFFVVFSADWD